MLRVFWLDTSDSVLTSCTTVALNLEFVLFVLFNIFTDTTCIMASSLDSSVLTGEVDKEALSMEALKDFSYCFAEYRRRTFINWPFCETDKCNPDAVSTKLGTLSHWLILRHE